MRLSTQNSQFYFLFPVWFYKPVESEYSVLLRKNKVQYENVADYLNSTIKEIDIPGLNFDIVTQPALYGKELSFSGSKSDYDLSTRTSTVIFRDVDAKINYFIMEKLLKEHYYNTAKPGLDKFGNISLTTMDIHGDAIFRILFKGCLITNFSGTKFGYADQSAEEKTFTLGFKYNFYDIKLALGNDEVEGDLLLREQIYEDGSILTIPEDTSKKSSIQVIKSNRI